MILQSNSFMYKNKLVTKEIINHIQELLVGLSIKFQTFI